MDQKKLKDAKNAMNARMLLLAAGIILIMNSVTSAGRTGLGLINIVNIVTNEADDYVLSEQTTETSTTENTTGKATETKDETSETTDKTTETAAVTDDSSAEADKTDETATETAEKTVFTVADLKQNMVEANVTASGLKTLGTGYIVFAILSALIGLFCVLNCNRVDRASLIWKAVIGLLVLEAAMIVLLYVTNMLNAGVFGSFLYYGLITGALVFGAYKMRKLAKDNPDRVYAVEKQQRYQKPAAPAPKKSLRDRAMMSTDIETAETNATETINDVETAAAEVIEDAEATAVDAIEEVETDAVE